MKNKVDIDLKINDLVFLLGYSYKYHTCSYRKNLKVIFGHD